MQKLQNKSYQVFRRQNNRNRRKLMAVCLCRQQPRKLPFITIENLTSVFRKQTIRLSCIKTPVEFGLKKTTTSATLFTGYTVIMMGERYG
jgi:hypothetical protein